MPIINSVIKGAGGGAGQTITCYDRTTGVVADDKVLINPNQNGLPIGKLWTSSPIFSTGCETYNGAGNQYVKGAAFGSYFSGNNTLFGSTSMLYATKSNETPPYVVKYSDLSETFEPQVIDYPMRSSTTTNYGKVKTNAFYNINLYITSTSGATMWYYNTVTEQYESTNVVINASGTGTNNGVNWSHDGKYLFWYHPAANGKVFEVYEVTKNNETGVISLTQVCSDNGTIITETPNSSNNYINVSANDYSFIVYNSSNWPSNLGTSTTCKIYQYNPSTQTLSLKRSFVGSAVGSCFPVLLADGWFIGNNSTALYLYKWDGTAYSLYSSVGTKIGSGNYSNPFTEGIQMGCTKLFFDYSPESFGVRPANAGDSYTPTFIYVNDLTNPTATKLINSSTESLIKTNTYGFKDKIIQGFETLYDETGTKQTVTVPLNYAVCGFMVDEYSDLLIRKAGAYSNNYTVNLSSDITTDTQITGNLHGQARYFFLNKQAVLSSSPSTVTTITFDSGVFGSGLIAYLDMEYSNTLFSLNNQTASVSTYKPFIMIEDDSTFIYKGNKANCYGEYTKVTTNGPTFYSTTLTNFNLVHTSSTDSTKVYRFDMTAGTATTTTVDIGTVGVSDITWGTQETWTLPDTKTNTWSNYIVGKIHLMLKDNKNVYIDVDGYLTFDETNKVISYNSYPTAVLNQLENNSILDMQVFYDSKFAVITKKGTYLFSYTNGDISTATFVSFLESDFADWYDYVFSSNAGCPGPYYSCDRTYAYEAFRINGIACYQLLKKNTDLDIYDYIANDKNHAVSYTVNSITGKVKETGTDANNNKYLTAEVVL